MKKIFFLLFSLLLVFGAKQVKGGLTNVSWTASSTEPNATGVTYTFTFTTHNSDLQALNFEIGNSSTAWALTTTSYNASAASGALRLWGDPPSSYPAHPNPGYKIVFANGFGKLNIPNTTWVVTIEGVTNGPAGTYPWTNFAIYTGGWVLIESGSPAPLVIGTPAPPPPGKTLPIVTTNPAVTNITKFSATVSGNVTSDGGDPSGLVAGIVWGYEPSPDILKWGFTQVTGPFSGSLTNLAPNKTIYFRSFADNSVGTSYGSEYTFTTLLGPADPANFETVGISTSQIDLSWELNGNNDNVLVAFNATNTFGEPSGTYTSGSSITGGGTVLYAGTNTSYYHTSLTIGTHYYYKIWSKNTSAVYSLGATNNVWTLVSNVPPVLVGWAKIGTDIDAEAAGDKSGNSVSLSSDGSVLAIGAYQNDGNGSNAGQVRIYKNISGTWTKIGADIDGEAASDNSGFSVSLSSDGSVVAIGAPWNGPNGYSNAGHVRIYKNISGTWTKIGADIDGEALNENSGFSVSLSSDGTVVAIGVPYNDGAGTDTGRTSVYKNQGGTWTKIGADIYGESTNDISGRSVSLSSDGSVVAIGSPTFYNGTNNNGPGQVRIYKNTNGTWTKIGADIDGEAANDYSGYTVSLSSDGSIVAIGAIQNDGNGSNAGQVRIYKNTNGTWTKIGADIDGEAASDQSGYWVSLSSDGSVVAIGALFNDGNGSNAGHVRVYQNINGTWTKLGSDLDGEAADDYSGNTVSLSSDGSVVAIGAFFNDGRGTDSGHVRVYEYKIPMELKFTTTDENQSIALPLYGTVSCNINWGDGSVTNNITTTGKKLHTFAHVGTYTVKISGTLTVFGAYKQDWDGAQYLTEVVSFGKVGLTELPGAFRKAVNLSDVPAALPSSVLNLSDCFSYNNKPSITNLDLWDVSKVTNMSDMFNSAPVFNQNISAWNVGSATNMSNMFNSALAFNQNISTWNIVNVTNMTSMFGGVTLSTANYDAILTSWSAKTVKPNVVFGGGNSKCSCGAVAARAVLTGASNNWTITDGGISGPIWDGSASTDWNVAANWSCNTVPLATDNVLIPHVARNPIINLAAASPAVCNNLTIEPGAVLTIPAGKALTVNGTLTNNAGITGLVVQSVSSAADGTGALLNGTADVLGTVERYVSGNTWHLISPAATAGETVASFVLLANGNLVARNANNYALSLYNEGTGKWEYYKVAGLNAGQFGFPAKGLQVLRATGPGTGKGGGSDSGKLTFKGTLGAGDQNIAVTKSGNGWNLVGNPYPCGMDIEKFIAANTALLDPSYQFVYVSNIGDVTDNGYVPLTSGLKMAPGEGFFVRPKVGGGTISFTTAMKSNVTDAFKAATIANPNIQLTAEDGNAKLQTTVQYIGGATKGLDPGKDAGLFNGIASTFSLFTRLIEDNGVDFTIQALPHNNLGSMVVPVGLVADKGESVKFKAVATNLPAGYKVVLEDKETNTFTRLDEANSSYTVSLAAATLGTGRFYLHMDEIVSAIDESLLSAVKVVPIPEQHLVRIIGNFDLPAKAMVYDMNGKLVATSMLASQIENDIPLTNCATGVYLLKIDSGKDVETVKFVWKRK